MVGIEDPAASGAPASSRPPSGKASARSAAPQSEAIEHCHGCGRPLDECAGERACGRGGPDHPWRFCPACGERLRDIVVVPGVDGRWCRTHGVVG